MNYVIRSKHDNRSLLARPAKPGECVMWVDPVEGREPWTFQTQRGAGMAQAMLADCGEVIRLTQVNNVQVLQCDAKIAAPPQPEPLTTNTLGVSRPRLYWHKYVWHTWHG